MAGAATIATLPTAAHAFTQKQCDVIMAAFDDHTTANFKHYSATDKVELGKFANWVTGAACAKGEPIVLVRYPEVGAALSSVQFLIRNVPDKSLQVALSPTVSFTPAPTAVRPTTISTSQRDRAANATSPKPSGG